MDFRTNIETMEISDSSDVEMGPTMDLFGKDLDLRTLNAPPAPSFVQHDGLKSPEENFQAVRAKLAEVSKQTKDKLGRPLLYNQLPDDPVERKRKVVVPATSADTDLRQASLRQTSNEEDLNNSMNIIITQAQEELKNNKIDVNQFKGLVHQVWALNENQKLRQAAIRENHPMVIASGALELPNVVTSPWVPQLLPVGAAVPSLGAATVPLMPVQPVAPDTVRTIQIDSIPRDIRFYDETAVVFMDNNDPRKIGFENGSRLLTISGCEPVLLHFNDVYKPVLVDGKIHQVRFGMYPSFTPLRIINCKRFI